MFFIIVAFQMLHRGLHVDDGVFIWSQLVTYCLLPGFLSDWAAF